MFQPRNYWEASFPFRGPEKHTSLESKYRHFCPWGPCLGPQDMDQKFQKRVSDTFIGPGPKTTHFYPYYL